MCEVTRGPIFSSPDVSGLQNTAVLPIDTPPAPLSTRAATRWPGGGASQTRAPPDLFGPDAAPRAHRTGAAPIAQKAERRPARIFGHRSRLSPLPSPQTKQVIMPTYIFPAASASSAAPEPSWWREVNAGLRVPADAPGVLPGLLLHDAVLESRGGQARRRPADAADGALSACCGTPSPAGGARSVNPTSPATSSPATPSAESAMRTLYKTYIPRRVLRTAATRTCPIYRGALHTQH